MTPADLSRLEALAREATPGPWVADDTNEQLFGVMKDGVLHYLGSADPGLFSTSPTTAEREVANAAYIAAANPAAVLALIERVRELEADAGRFLHLANEASIHGAMGERFYLEWHGQGVDIRDAIDAAMKEDKP